MNSTNPNHIAFFDTTLRDGEQSPGCSMTTQEKLTMAHALEDLGVDIIEAGFAMASEGDFAAISTITQAIRKPRIASLARAKQEDVEIAARAIQFAERPRIHVFLASSDLHLEYKLKIGRQEALDRTGECVRLARSFVDDVEFSPEDATRSDRDFLVEMVRIAVEAGATTINMPDTVGYTTPEEYGAMFREVRERIPAVDEQGVILSSHCHDDLGLAVANSLAAIQAGARQVECTINGIGERAGNASLEEVVMALHTRRNHYRHETGIHQHGVLANRETYEIMTPETIGIPSNKLVLGKHSGRHAFKNLLESNGVRLSDQELQRAFEEFKTLCDKKKQVTADDILALVEGEMRAGPHTFELKSFHISTSSSLPPMASITLLRGRELFTEEASGDGPVDAMYNAINKIVGLAPSLADYAIKAVTGGTDAIGDATVKVRDGDGLFIGRGTSTDILEASAKAYLAAVNKIIHERQHWMTNVYS